MGLDPAFNAIAVGASAAALFPGCTAVPFDYGAIVEGHRIAYFGEDHGSDKTQYELGSAVMDALREKRFTHVAFECIFSTPFHTRVWERYARKELSGEEAYRLHGRPFGYLANWKPTTEGVIDAAIAGGMIVRGIELVRGEEVQLDYEALGLTPQQLEKALKSGHARQLYAKHDVIRRNWHAMQVLADILRDPAAKVAVTGGFMHYGYMEDGLLDMFTLNNLVKRFMGVSGPVIHMLDNGAMGYQLATERSEEDGLNLAVDRAAIEAHRQQRIGQNLMMRTSPGGHELTPDYVALFAR